MLQPTDADDYKENNRKLNRFLPLPFGVIKCTRSSTVTLFLPFFLIYALSFIKVKDFSWSIIKIAYKNEVYKEIKYIRINLNTTKKKIAPWINNWFSMEISLRWNNYPFHGTSFLYLSVPKKEKDNRREQKADKRVIQLHITIRKTLLHSCFCHSPKHH